jgi:sugar lactone lactonase YvrE
MKLPSVALPLFALVLTLQTASAQLPNFPAADKVLGAPNFLFPGSATATASGMSGPTAISVDPATGKLFVAVAYQSRILRFGNAADLANGANAEVSFGQPDLSGVSSGATATTLNLPYGAHLDGSGRLWVADFSNHRVLMFEDAATVAESGPVPALVLGQPDFTTVSSGDLSSKMKTPLSVFLDAGDNLWVADYGNHRVLKFANVTSLSNGAAATTVLGQPDFVTPPAAGTGANTMNGPNSVMVDAAGRLWVTEQSNNRVLRFDNAASLGNGASANGVLGQANFFSLSAATTAQGLSSPSASTMDTEGTLYVADFSNCRVILYLDAANKANGAAADGVIGQTDFVSNTPGRTHRRLGPPAGLAFDQTGALWVSDHTNNRLLRFAHDRSAVPPQVTGKVPKATSASKVAIKGTASDTSDVASVRFRVGKGAFKNASGTTAWKLSAKLKPGKNTIEIVAVDSLGNVSPAKRVKVTRE